MLDEGPGMTSGPVSALLVIECLLFWAGISIQQGAIPPGPQKDLVHLPTVPYNVPSMGAHFCSSALPTIL